MKSLLVSKKLAVTMTLITFGLGGARCAYAIDAAKWPDRPIRVVVGFSPGGGADIVARIVTAKMGAELGWEFVVENRPGATGQIAASTVARAAPDGYTLMLDATAFSINPVLYDNLPYNAKTDFAPISLLVKFPLLLVKNKNFKPENVKEIIAEAKDKPGSVSYGSSGVGSVQHLATALFARDEGLKLLHVPYKGGSQSISDLIGGQIQFIFANGASSLPYALDKQILPLATTGAKRSQALPDVPTMEEAGVPNFQVYEWTALFAPNGTPASIVEKLSKAAQNALKDPSVKEKLEGMGGEIVGATSVETAEYIQGQTDHWEKVIKENDIKVE